MSIVIQINLYVINESIVNVCTIWEEEATARTQIMKEVQFLILWYGPSKQVLYRYNTIIIELCPAFDDLFRQLLLVGASTPSVACYLEMKCHISSVVILHLPSLPSK